MGDALTVPPYPADGPIPNRVGWLFTYGPWLLVGIIALTLAGVTVHSVRAFYREECD